MDSPTAHGFRYPFGEVSCETEVRVLQEQYQDYYYTQTRFNVEVTDEDNYLIVGRRGSGKSSLAKYLEFQPVLKNARCMDVDEPEVYDELFRKVQLSTYPSNDLLVARLVTLWEYLIWNLIFHCYQNDDKAVQAACLIQDRRSSPARLIADILKHLFSKLIGDEEGTVADEVERHLSSVPYEEAKKRVLAITARQPVIIAIDTIERYDKSDDRLMGIVAALVQTASDFNVEFARFGIHVKVFVSAEVFPHLKESVITNTTKYIRHPVQLQWRPKDLIHLACWRFYKYLDERNILTDKVKATVNWSSFESVVDAMWLPYFGASLRNGRGMEEATFPYLLRHTQMRPRQLVELCNYIARHSIKQGTFPFFYQSPIVHLVKESERELANEVLNSYALIYPRVSDIVDALQASPMRFPGSHLDRVAKLSNAAWPRGEYSPDSFRRLMAELGIVGRVRSVDERTRIMAADFEYASEDRLALQSTDDCVIHPMFYSRLNTDVSQHMVVYPFPDHPDFELLKVSYYAPDAPVLPKLTRLRPGPRTQRPKQGRQ